MFVQARDRWADEDSEIAIVASVQDSMRRMSLP